MDQERGRVGYRRLLAGCILLLAVLLCSWWSLPYRTIEAAITSQLLAFVTTSTDYSDHFGVSNALGTWQWFRVTTECTSAVLLVPIAIATAWLVSQRRVRIDRALLGFGVGWAIVATASTFRLFAIGLNYHLYGMPSFWITHNLVGSLITLASTIFALFVQVRITTSGADKRGRSFEPATGAVLR